MIIFTDGSCRSNGKENSVGGYGVVVCDDENNVIACFREDKEHTTNNEMELMAILCAMEKYGKWPIEITVYSDSAYAVNTFNEWMFSWAQNDWTRGPKHEPIKNLELIQYYYKLYQEGYRIDLKKVKGHNNIKGNELADALATGAIKTKQEIMKFWENN